MKKDLYKSLRANFKQELQQSQMKSCQHHLCNEKAEYKALLDPKRSECREFLWFCYKHIRLYNSSYNFFHNMSNEDMKSFVNEQLYGNRATKKNYHNYNRKFKDYFSFINDYKKQEEEEELSIEERHALKVLEADVNNSPDEVKEKYKVLLKRYHPDHNMGDRSKEELLKQVIVAYRYLKTRNLSN